MQTESESPPLSDRLMRCWLGLQVIALFVGTMMPGGIRNRIQGDVERGLTSGLNLSSMAHLLLFACMAFTMTRLPFQWRAVRIVLVALVLALLSEGMQYFAIDRHPRWIDVGIDMAGALLGLGIGGMVSLWVTHR